MKTQTLRYLLTLALAFILVGMSVSSHAKEALPVGSVLFVHGEVSIFSSDGEQRTASRGDDIFEGDRIVSSAASSMQIKMVDSGYLAIRPSTEIRIDKYRFEQNQNDRAETSLLRGGLRSITGTIGKTRKESFKLRTPVATIGIRGTDLEVFYVPSNRSTVLAKGAYLRINSGRGYIQTFAGVQFVKPNQTGFVSNRRSSPKLVVLPPDLFNEPDADFWPSDTDLTGDGNSADVEQSGGEAQSSDDPIGQTNAQVVENDAIPSEDDVELVDLDLPPDLQESWDSEYQVEEETYFEVTEVDLGDLSTVTSTEVIAAQSGTFSYAPSSMGVSDGDLASSSVALDIDFNADLVTYDLMLDFSSPIAPAAVSGANGGMWVFAGEGALSSFIGETGLALAGTYESYADQSVVDANGIWYGFFTGGNADGLFSSFELYSLGYSVTGFTETTQRTEIDEVPLTSPYSLLMTTGRYSNLYSSLDTPDTVVNVSASGGQLISVDDQLTGYEYLEGISGQASSYTMSSGETVTWGKWDGFISESIEGSFESPDYMYYAYFDSNLVTDLNSLSHSRMHAKYSLLDVVAHNAAGNSFDFDGDTSYLMIDFNSGVVQGQLEMYSADVDGSQESWWVEGYSNLYELSNGQGSMSLFGSVSNNTKELIDDVDGQWDFAWGGSSGEFLAGGFYLTGTTTDINQNLIFSADGVMVFAGEVPNASLLDSGTKGLVSTGHKSGYQPLLTDERSFNFNALSGAYVDSNDSRVLLGFFSNNYDTKSYSVDPGLAQLTLGETSVGSASEKIVWGRWDNVGDTGVLHGNVEGIEPAQVLHYIMADNFTTLDTLSALGSSNIEATYSLVGGTAPSLIKPDGTTDTGTLTSLVLNVNFGSQLVDANMGIDLTDRTIDASGMGYISDFTNSGIYMMDSSDQANGYMSGQFVGNDAEGVIVSYELKGSVGQINGVAGLEQTSSGVASQPPGM